MHHTKELAAMAEEDLHDDVIVVGSGFGGSVAAHAYGSAKLLHHMAHRGKLTGLSDQLGQAGPHQLRAAAQHHPDLWGVEACP
jgi:hypothetical protein